jgi:hypothetical protein
VVTENQIISNGAISRPPIQKWAVILFTLFLIVNLPLTLPLLCPGGNIAGLFKMIFFLLAVLRLLFGLIQRNLKPVDFLLWAGSSTGFSIFADFLF